MPYSNAIRRLDYRVGRAATALLSGYAAAVGIGAFGRRVVAGVGQVKRRERRKW